MRAKFPSGWCVLPLLAIAWAGTSPLSITGLAAPATTSDLRLVEAVKTQNTQAVRALLKQRVDVNARQGDGATALHWATHWDDRDTADLLIRAGASVNAANDLGVTPLSLACSNGSAAMIERLLKAGANPNAALRSGETPLMTASRTGSVAAVQSLLDHGAQVNSKETLRGQTALMWAVAQQHRDIVQTLLEHGADLHARTNTWLQVVSSSGNADPSGIREVEQGGFTPLLFAARLGDLDSTRLLLTAGANVNDTASAGTSALVVAAHSGHGALAALLLEKGADPNAAAAGYTALHAAVLRGDVQLAKALLAHGANPNAPLVRGTPARRTSQDWTLPHALIGTTPFWLAAKFAEPEIMRILAANGADPLFVFQSDGTTPLMVAIAEDSDRRNRFSTSGQAMVVRDAEVERLTLDTVKVAAELGADVNAANKAGDAPLHTAASSGLGTVVQFLVERGANLDVKNKRGQTPLAMVLAAGPQGNQADTGAESRQRTAALLRKLGAKE